MKLNLVVKICLLSAILLIVGVLFAKANGFVSFEPSGLANQGKIILWDNVRMVNQGLKMSPYGANDISSVAGGNIDIQSKDLYVRKKMAFGCATNYPKEPKCSTEIGDIGGNAFLKIDTLGGQDLTLISNNSGISLEGSLIDMTGKLILTGSHNLVVYDSLPDDLTATNSTFTDALRVSELKDLGLAGLTLPDIQLGSNAFFYTNRIINLSLSNLP
jgi:hypothetical protein